MKALRVGAHEQHESVVARMLSVLAVAAPKPVSRSLYRYASLRTLGLCGCREGSMVDGAAPCNNA